jgi:hypothetical protein
MADLDDLARALEAAPDEARKQVRPVVAKGALNVKTAWRKSWAGLSSAPALAGAVTYDVRSTTVGAAAEIGPDVAKRQGYLGNLIEYGSVNNRPRPGGRPAAEAEEPRLAKALEDLGAQAVER